MCSVFSSCRLFGHDEPDIISYRLAFSFQDEAGNDLVKGIELNPGSPHSEQSPTDNGWVKSDSDYTLAECYRIEFDGKSFTPEITIDQYEYQVIITLKDRK
jgi:hypothetical protein